MTTATKALITKEDGSQQKNIYHSHIQRLGGTMVQFKSECHKSKFPKGSATHYVYLTLPDENEYCLAVEPECVEAINAAPKGTWVHVTAGGSADTPNWMKITLPEDRPYEASDEPPPIEWPEDTKAIETTRVQMGGNATVARAVSLTVEAVKALEAQGIAVDPTPIYSTHYIQCSRG